jgi:hypothetical protein
MDALKPFLLLACVAFVTGFAGYVAVLRVQDLASPVATWQGPIEATAPAPMTADSWNIGKRI